MGKIRLTDFKIKQIIELRKTGHSFPEIKKIVGCGYATVYRYAHSVKIKNSYLGLLKEKQGKSRIRSVENWKEAKVEARKLLGTLEAKNKLCILLGLYWGEGTKRELNLINGDAALIKVFLEYLKEIGVKKEDITLSLRVYGKNNISKTLIFWSKQLNVKRGKFRIGEITDKSGENKLPNGMCRVRVRKSAKYFKLLMSMIEYVKQQV